MASIKPGIKATATIESKPATTSSPKTASKPASKKAAPAKAAKTAVSVKAAAKSASKSGSKPAPVKTLPRKTAASKPAAKPAAVPAAEAKPPKIKLVRDSFTIPRAEYEALGALKDRLVKLTRPAKKSEVLRAGIAVLATLNDAALCAALDAVPAIKTGRPKKAK